MLKTTPFLWHGMQEGPIRTPGWRGREIAGLADRGSTSPFNCQTMSDTGRLMQRTCRVTTERLSLRIDANLKKDLEREARREERSVSYLAVKAIESILRERAEKRAAIRAAVSEAEEGAFISQEAMDAWVSSWGENSELPPPKPDVQMASQ